MKRIFIVSVLCVSIAYSQQYPINCFRMYSAVRGETPFTHTQQLAKTFPLYESAYFNNGLAFLSKDYSPNIITDAEITQLLDSAAAHNIKMILHYYINTYGGAERLYLDANDDYFNHRRGEFVSPPDQDAEQPDPHFYDHTSLEATVPNEYMVKNTKYGIVHPNYYLKGYKAYFRLKVLRTGTPADTTPVADIEIWDSTKHSSVQRVTLRSKDFSTDNTYYTFPIVFSSNADTIVVTESSQSSTPQVARSHEEIPLQVNDVHIYIISHSFDVRVFWHGQIPVWLDNIRVDGMVGNPDSFFGGLSDADIKTKAKKFNAHPALARFYLKDEPYINQYLACDKVNKVLKIAAQENGITPGTGKGLGYTAKTDDDPIFGTYNRYAQETTPYELATNIYRFYEWDPVPSDLDYTYLTQTRVLQSAIDKFKPAQQSSIFAESKTWQYFPNITRWDGFTREPYLNEIYSQVNLALAYGAKGIHYFNYLTENSTKPKYVTGLVDPIALNPINSSSPYSVYGENKWDGIKALNQKLAGALGTTLMTLTWQNAFSIHQSQPTGTFISSVTTIDASSETYVELGVFKDASNNNYFMIVNRRTKNDESRNITVNFSLPAGSYEIEEVLSHHLWIVPSTGNITDNLSPGEGRLYKIGPATWSGNKNILFSTTVASGATLSINQGASIKFATDSNLVINGKLLATGTTSQPNTFSSLSENNRWGTLVFNGSGASGSRIEYSVIRNAKEIAAIGVPSILLSCDTIENNINGVRYDNYTNGWVAGCVIKNPRDHGILVVNGSTAACYWNTITNTDRNGYGILYGGGSSDYCWGNNISGFDMGIGAIWGSSPTLGHPANTGINNHITNCRKGLEIRKWSYPTVGVPPEWDDSATIGNNFFNNTYKSAYVYDCTDDNIFAEYVYWGSVDPLIFPSLFYQYNVLNFDYSNPLPNCTWGEQQLNISGNESNHTSSLSKLVDNPLIVGIKLRSNGKYKEAVSTFKSIIKNNPKKSSAYIELYKTLNDTSSIEVTNLFTALPTEAPPVAKLILSNLLLKQGKIKSSKNVNNVIIEDYPNSAISQNAKLKNFYIALYFENDRKQAMSILNDITSNPDLMDNYEIVLAQQALELQKNFDITWNSNLTKEEEEISLESIPSKLSLLQNYPNPFNPTTTIKYELPVSSYVTLKVYDIMGRVVAVLVDGMREAGYQSAMFNASNLASGIYFSRLTVREQNGNINMQTKKMVLMK